MEALSWLRALTTCSSVALYIKPLISLIMHHACNRPGPPQYIGPAACASQSLLRPHSESRMQAGTCTGHMPQADGKGSFVIGCWHIPDHSLLNGCASRSCSETCMQADTRIEHMLWADDKGRVDRLAARTYQIIHCLVLGVCGGVESKQPGVMVVGVEGHVRVREVVDGHALRHHTAGV